MITIARAKFRGTAAVTLFAFTALTVAAPIAQAGIVGTEQAFAGVALDAERGKLNEALARDDVRAMLVARGVEPAAVQARVAALSADEVRVLNQQLDQLPAGGDLIGAAVFIFVLLLVTDLLGWTDVFPFTKKGAIGD